MKRYVYCMIVAVLLLSACQTIPKQSGLAIHDVRPAVKPAGVYTVVEVDTNLAAAMSEPYPSMIAYIWQPAESDKNKMVWQNNATPKHILKAPDGNHYRAVGISFKDREGNAIEPCQNGKITASPEMLSVIEPWYGGKKKIIIPGTLKPLVEGGYRIVTMTNDDSPAKHVYLLDGKGVMGEKWGTPYHAFNPNVHGAKFFYDNPRIYEVHPGDDKDKEIQLWLEELLLKAAIVAFKKDAAEYSMNRSFSDYHGFALDPFSKQWVARKTSRLNAVLRALGQIDFGPAVITNLKDFGIGLVATKGVNTIAALFSEQQYFLFGSAGSYVYRYDWIVSLLESTASGEDLQKIKARNMALNAIIIEYNELVDRCNFAFEAKERQEACKKVKEMANDLRVKEGLPSLPK